MIQKAEQWKSPNTKQRIHVSDDMFSEVSETIAEVQHVIGVSGEQRGEKDAEKLLLKLAYKNPQIW